MSSNQKSIAIDPDTLLAIRDLELRARIVVEGMWMGLHRSPDHGFSVEFSEYRQYSPGDDLRYLDWKTLARTDREYLKIFEDETNLRCQILLDSSKSMSFGSAAYTKYEYARTLAATLSYFLLQQRDVVGLARFENDIQEYLQARWRPGHFKRLLALLERKAEGRQTNLRRALNSLARLCRKRSLIVIISDFLSEPEEWERSISYLSAAGHDLRAIQILDPAELSLEFGKSALWEDIESNETLYVDPEVARKRYVDRFERRRKRLNRIFDENSIRHLTVTTNEPLDTALLAFLSATRSSGFKSRRRRSA